MQFDDEGGGDDGAGGGNDDISLTLSPLPLLLIGFVRAACLAL